MRKHHAPSSQPYVRWELTCCHEKAHANAECIHAKGAHQQDQQAKLGQVAAWRRPLTLYIMLMDLGPQAGGTLKKRPWMDKGTAGSCLVAPWVVYAAA